MLIEAHDSAAATPRMFRLGNPAVPLLGARIRYAIDRLSTGDIDQLGGDCALSRVTEQSRLRALVVETCAVCWSAGAADCDGRSGIKVQAELDYVGDRGLLAIMAWDTVDPLVTVEITDRKLILTASGVVEDPEELIGAIRDTIVEIERNITIQIRQVIQANAAAKPLAAVLLRRRVRRDANVCGITG